MTETNRQIADALRAYTQADEDGVIVKVSRQACEEAAAILDTADARVLAAREAGISGVTDDQIKHMVNRFLGWRLPEYFRPDAGISFEPEFNVEWNAKQGRPPQRHEPTGTNLFDAGQATAMVRYMLDGMPEAKPTERDAVLEKAALEIESAGGDSTEYHARRVRALKSSAQGAG